MCGSDKAVERASFAYHESNLGRRLNQHADLVLPKDAGIDRLNDENTLENASINERNTEERLVSILAGLTEIFEARMIPDLFNGNRTNLLGNESRETLME